MRAAGRELHPHRKGIKAAPASARSTSPRSSHVMYPLFSSIHPLLSLSLPCVLCFALPLSNVLSLCRRSFFSLLPIPSPHWLSNRTSSLRTRQCRRVENTGQHAARARHERWIATAEKRRSGEAHEACPFSTCARHRTTRTEQAISILGAMAPSDADSVCLLRRNGRLNFCA